MLLALAAALAAAQSRAQSETDRLREALRAAITQTRALEDQRAAMQARLAEAERQIQVLRAQIDAAKAQAKDAEDALRKGIDEFNARVAESDAILEKWKAAYAQAADVARAKDGERAKFESEATTLKTRATTCEAKNARLIKIGKEIVAGYRDLNLLDHMAIREPFIGFARVAHQNCEQDYRHKILDQDAKLPPPSAPPLSAPDQKTAVEAANSQKIKDQNPKAKK
jgi:chromosome segregation ATPase